MSGARKFEHEVSVEIVRPASFAKCLVCGKMATRIGPTGHIGKWRHVR